MARKSVIAHIWRWPGDWLRGTETWSWLNHGKCYYGGGHMIMYLPKPMELHTHNDVEVYLKVKNSIMITENSRWNADCYISWPVLQMSCTSVGGGEDEEKWTSTTLIKGLWLKTQKDCAQTSNSGKHVSHRSQDISPKYWWQNEDGTRGEKQQALLFFWVTGFCH